MLNTGDFVVLLKPIHDIEQNAVGVIESKTEDNYCNVFLYR